jgi:tetratricopeptide (TPR) repeat protein
MATAYQRVSAKDEAVRYAKLAYKVSPKPSYKLWIYGYSYIIYYNIASSYFTFSSKNNYAEALKIDQDALSLYADLPDNIRLSYFELSISAV